MNVVLEPLLTSGPAATYHPECPRFVCEHRHDQNAVLHVEVVACAVLGRIPPEPHSGVTAPTALRATRVFSGRRRARKIGATFGMGVPLRSMAAVGRQRRVRHPIDSGVIDVPLARGRNAGNRIVRRHETKRGKPCVAISTRRPDVFELGRLVERKV